MYTDDLCLKWLNDAREWSYPALILLVTFPCVGAAQREGYHQHVLAEHQLTEA